MYKQWVCIWHSSQYLQSCHDSYCAMFLLCPPRLVSFPLPSQLPLLCYQATVLVYKYLVSHWPHPVSEMMCSSFSTYTVPCFHLHDSLCSLSVHWSYSFVFCCILYLSDLCSWWANIKPWSLSLPSSLVLRFKIRMSHYHCRDFSR